YALPLPVLFISLFIGPSGIASSESIFEWVRHLIFNVNVENMAGLQTVQSILLDVRLPRIILAFLVGGALSISGSSLQAIFRNPLVSPYILGLSSGAAFGAALALAWAFLPVQLSAFFFGLIAVALSYVAAIKHKNLSIVSLILSGVIVTGIFTALLTVVQYLSDPFKLQSIVHWTMGNLHNASWKLLKASCIPILLGVLILYLMRWRLNVLALGDEEARTSGVNPTREKIIVLVAATLASSAAVSVAGIIGLYGLIIPHMVRMMIGPDNKQGTVINFLFGGTFLLIIDDFSRTIAGFEIPIGVITMLIGAPFFLYLMKKTNIGWEN
ncbi:MAG: iron ABC transporter permease, partial [Bacteroidales bacterium]|nr:iron ABC transporter permease [Bacteroidales bacterium]